jgi:hypothetical protein
MLIDQVLDALLWSRRDEPNLIGQAAQIVRLRVVSSNENELPRGSCCQLRNLRSHEWKQDFAQVRAPARIGPHRLMQLHAVDFAFAVEDLFAVSGQDLWETGRTAAQGQVRQLLRIQRGVPQAREHTQDRRLACPQGSRYENNGLVRYC